MANSYIMREGALYAERTEIPVFWQGDVIVAGEAIRFQLRFGGQGLLLEDLRLEAHEHRGGQECLAGGGQVALVTAAVAGPAHQARGPDPLAQLVEEAIDHGNHIDVPGVDLATLGGILQQADRQPGACFSHGASTTTGNVPRLEGDGQRKPDGASGLLELRLWGGG